MGSESRLRSDRSFYCGPSDEAGDGRWIGGSEAVEEDLTTETAAVGLFSEFVDPSVLSVRGNV
jgi:hypothetical protein